MKTFLIYTLLLFTHFQIVNSIELKLDIYKDDFYKMSLTSDFLSELADVFKISTFVETGTGMGYTTDVAKYIFDDVYSIEMSKNLFNICSSKFINDSNVHIYLGSSEEIFPEILNNINGTTLFWLDGHNSPGMAPGLSNTPLLHELEQIKQSNIKNPILLIDDIRCSLWPLYDWDKLKERYGNEASELYDTIGLGWPTLPEILRSITSIDNRYVILLYCDALLAYIDDDSTTGEPIFSALLKSALSIADSKIVKNLSQVDNTIRNMSDEAFLCIKQQVEDFEIWELPCYHPHLHFWYGLGLLERGLFDQAHKQFQLAQDGGMDYQKMEHYKAFTFGEKKCLSSI